MWQRRHDALEEACLRLIAAGCVPGRAGQPAQIQVHMTLDQLRGLAGPDGEAGRAAAWPPAAPGTDCDASVVPVVTGHLDHQLLAELTCLTNLLNLCTFHHLIAVHRWGWAITLHPDGTTTATSPDGRTLHSHSPPATAA